MNIHEIIERIKKEEVIEEVTVKKICKKVQEVFMTESNVEQVSSPINLVGDVHGQFYDVQKLLKIGRGWLTQRVIPPLLGLSSSEIL